ncbi:MAG: S46 family peptidase, partial [Bacteroidales bacterium]|nr:S46 family peptidase [Bacteroidales bacterium]
DANNEPADYSPSNVPMRPRQFLNISLKGVQEGDFAMIMGYPGSTQRFQTATQLQDMLATNDVRIDARGIRQDVLWKAMRADSKVGLQYANKYASSSNGWKKWIGEREAFAALDIIGREEQKERDLTAWINADPARQEAYGGAIDRIAASIEGSTAPKLAVTLLSETLGRIELLGFANTMDRSMQMALNAKDQEADTQNLVQQTLDTVMDMLAEEYEDYDCNVDRDVAIALIDHYKARVNPADAVMLNGKSILSMDTRKLVDNLFKKSIFTSPEKLAAKPITAKLLAADPAVQLAKAVTAASQPLTQTANAARTDLAAASKAYGAALLKWTEGQPSYPDANSTCRLTYGTVKSYEPKDGVLYKYYTTLKGVMEKEDPSNYEFIVPAKLKEIYQNKDYGQYANAQGELVTCFLTNLDITGGNSGSPVMDADGNLIGLAFDGNWEAMSSDVMFEPNLQRCICVDIRYVLLMLDKYAGAGYLLNEMNLVKE